MNLKKLNIQRDFMPKIIINKLKNNNKITSFRNSNEIRKMAKTRCTYI